MSWSASASSASKELRRTRDGATTSSRTAGEYLGTWCPGTLGFMKAMAAAALSLVVSLGGSVVSLVGPVKPIVPRGRLPVGAAKGFPFGFAEIGGRKLSLLPPDADDVDQAWVARAPKLGPFRISLQKGFGGWPDACQLTDAAQLKALFPAITGLQGRPLGTRGQVPGRARPTPHDTHCTFTVATTFEPRDYTSYSNVQVQLFEVGPGTPSLWTSDQAAQEAEAKKYPTQYAYYPELQNGVMCFDDGTELQCLTGDIDYWVSGEKVTSGTYFSADQAVWADQVEIPLAEVLGAELSTVR